MIRIVLRTPYFILAAVVCLAQFAAALPVRGGTPIATPVDGEPFPARLVEVDPKWQIKFEAGKEAKTISAADLVAWGTCVEPTKGPLLVLADGGLLAADITGADKDNLTAESDLLGSLKLPLETLAGIVFHVPSAKQDRDKLLDRVARAGGDADHLLLDNGDDLAGLVEELHADKVRFKAEVGPVEVETKRIVALIFNPALRRKPAADGLRAWVGLGDGSRVLATRLAVAGSSAEITSALGPVWKTTPGDLVFVQPLGGRAVYLSDLKPAEYRHLPYLDLPWPYQRDRNVSGGWLRAGSRPFLKGLGVHSAARLSYDLDQPYQRFQAELAIDDSTGGSGSVGFRVFVDGKVKFTSGPVRGGAAPVPLSVDVAGAKRLDLVVDYGERGDELDHADWLDARLVK